MSDPDDYQLNAPEGPSPCCICGVDTTDDADARNGWCGTCLEVQPDALLAEELNALELRLRRVGLLGAAAIVRARLVEVRP